LSGNKKKVLLNESEFCSFTEYAMSHYEELNKKGLIHKEKKFIDVEKSLKLILDTVNEKNKVTRNRLLKLIKKVDKFRDKDNSPARINKTQFSSMLGWPYITTLERYLKDFENAPKAIKVGRNTYYDLKECNKFLEDQRIMPFSNDLAQRFIQRPYLKKNEKSIDKHGARKV